MGDSKDSKNDGFDDLDKILAQMPPERRAKIEEKARQLVVVEAWRNLGIDPTAHLTPELIDQELSAKSLTSDWTEESERGLRWAADLLYEQCELEALKFFGAFGKVGHVDKLTEESVRKMVEACLDLCPDESSKSWVMVNSRVLLVCLVHRLARQG